MESATSSASVELSVQQLGALLEALPPDGTPSATNGSSSVCSHVPLRDRMEEMLHRLSLKEYGPNPSDALVLNVDEINLLLGCMLPGSPSCAAICARLQEALANVAPPRGAADHGFRLTPSAAAALVPAPSAEEAQRPRALSSPPSHILPGLYLGDHGSSISYGKLVDLGITHILNVKGGSRVPPSPFDEQLSLASVPISDFGDDDLSSKLPQCFAAIDAAIDGGGACLVHCSQGMNRSPAIVLCYLMRSRRTRWTLREAWPFLKARRPMVSPHHLYWEQLRAIDRAEHGNEAAPLSAEEAGIFIPPAVADEARLREAQLREEQTAGPSLP